MNVKRNFAHSFALEDPFSRWTRHDASTLPFDAAATAAARRPFRFTLSHSYVMNITTFVIGEEHQLHQERKQTKEFIILNLYSLSFLARTVTRNARCGLRTF